MEKTELSNQKHKQYAEEEDYIHSLVSNMVGGFYGNVTF